MGLWLKSFHHTKGVKEYEKENFSNVFGFFAVCHFIVPDSAKAANLSVPREVSILDMVADDQPGIDSLTILKTGPSKPMENLLILMIS